MLLGTFARWRIDLYTVFSSYLIYYVGIWFWKGLILRERDVEDYACYGIFWLAFAAGAICRIRYNFYLQKIECNT
ncbi:uncharacterized protein MYCFIDRAFT_177581 [Pseudocercospora fijiensis CIRAD86]|uniref:Uncharacterized protein n=1 Tax=Pseudocercospora fijiensis (strain CIRAD86) TaxID=383855 RepID=M3A7R2_PSEFD|nr:uncharacterized protein MYCFIDRAFT_177581 [Pseudocercospora fijiensis CIRAD86]EME80651.1 hypothetical protein MYCFIDRAFT_177581 [Pseudocercospora fijiensis CIRAD86]